MADLEYTIDEGIATILLNRPHRRNAFTLDMLDTWSEALRSARTDPDVRVVMITGADGAFCSGIDLDNFAEFTSTLERQQVLTQRVHRVAAAAMELDKPLIAAVDGVAVGAGMDMALACDLRLASDRTRFSEGYVRVGLVPGDGGAHLLPRIVGEQRALELLWTGRFVEAQEALDLGIVLAVYPAADLAAEAEALCRQLADGPPVAIRAIKRLVRQGEKSDLLTSLSMAAAEQAVVQSTRDSAEAIAAFRDRRKPTFTGA